MIERIKHVINLARHALRDVGTKKERSPEWHKVEKEFLEKHPTCAACGGNIRLNVHHCMPFHLDPAKELATRNLITLCMEMGKECHLQIGHLGAFSRYNPDVRKDAAHILQNSKERADIIKKSMMAFYPKLVK